LITYKIKGGYFASPRWSGASVRRGYVHGAPVQIYTKEQLAEMTVDEINEVICRDLQEDAYERQMADPKVYKNRNAAYLMENLLFICPFCGAVDTITSSGDTVNCTACGGSFHYDKYGMLHGLSMKTVRELSDWQIDKVHEAADSDVTYTSEHAILSTIENHIATPIAEGKLVMDKNGLTCGDKYIRMEDITDLAMHGQHGIVLSAEKCYYELRPDKTSNALKYQLLYDAQKKTSYAVRTER